MKRIVAGRLAAVATLTLAVGLVACSPTTNCPQSGLPTTVAYKQVSGVAPNLLSLDVHAPAGACNAPVVIWVHGGGYVNGDKKNSMTDKVPLFNSNGWILVSVNYRLSTPGDPNKAQFPDHYEDLAAAVSWVRSNIGRYGGKPSALAVLGHSAGADIVSNVMTNPAYLSSHNMSLADVRCTAPLDTEGFDKVTADADDEDVQWRNALGNNPNYKVETSAITHIATGKGIPRTLGVYRGTAQRQSIEKAFVAKLAASGVATTLIDARSLSHEEVNSRIGAPGDTVMTPPLVQFLSSCFAG